MDGSTPSVPSAAEVAAAQPESEERNEKASEGDGDEEAILTRAQRLIARITAAQENPSPRLLHALASLIEAQENKYLMETESSSLNNGRVSHLVGRLGNLVRDSDEFYELVSSKILMDSGFSISVRSGAARIVLSCSSSWMYPHVFDDAVLDNVKSWVLEEPLETPADACDWRNEIWGKMPTDSEMLQTYATGLLALSLAGGTQVVEDLLTSGLSAKLMHFLRMRIFGETNASQKDVVVSAEAKLASCVSNSIRSKEENRGRRVLSSAYFDGANVVGDERLLGDQSGDRDHDRTIWRVCDEECGIDSLGSELTDSALDVGAYQVLGECADRTGDCQSNMELREGKLRSSERYVMDGSAIEEDVDENMRDDPTRRRTNRGWSRIRGKGKVNDGISEIERNNISTNSELRLSGPGRGYKGKGHLKNEESKRPHESKKNSIMMDLDVLMTREEDDDRYNECKIGSTDISALVKKAASAAEAEARAANAPMEAIKAAGDAAAELVKTSALEVWRNTSDEEAAVSAASQAASTVVDAAIATEVSRNLKNVNEGLVESKVVDHAVEEPEDFFLLDEESLAQLREKYCIQCLEILGDYVEALGPVLKEKGVDVCLGLLQRNVKDADAQDKLAFLPEVLKLICVLAGHRKFAALFVDRGGIQKLLLVRRVPQTYFGLSSCLFAIGSLQAIMERVCALPTDVVNQVVELALQLLECSQDQARKNAAIFFSATFVFRAVLDSFDAQEGLLKMLNLLRGATSIRSGGNSATLGVHNPSFRNDQSPGEVLTASEKQTAYHTCIALRHYFRAHLLLLVDSLRPNKASRGMSRSASSTRAAYKPLDISNEALDAVFLQIRRDRKLGPAFVRARWPAADKFMNANGHIIMLELCQASPVDRYLHDLQKYAFGVLHIVTFTPHSRKLVVNATLSNDRVGMAVILDAANGAVYADPEVIHPALCVLENLVCPPPSISTRPSTAVQGQPSISACASNGPQPENRDRPSERGVLDRTISSSTQNDLRECNGETAAGDRGGLSVPLSTIVPGLPSGVVGDRRISLGPGAGCAGLAAQLEQGYRQAREAVRANNGIKVLLHLLQPRMMTSPAVLDSLRALACRVLLGLARDEAIAHILTKLQVGKKLSELIRDSGSQASGSEQSRCQTELAQVAIELIAIVTNSGRASTLAATDAAAPTLRRIERAAIAAATPITYHSRELLLLIHEYLQQSGLAASAASLQKEADLTPLPSLSTARLPLHQTASLETSSFLVQWPSGRSPLSFTCNAPKLVAASREDDFVSKSSESALASSRKKPITFSSSISQMKNRSLTMKASLSLKDQCVIGLETPSMASKKGNAEVEAQPRTPMFLPMKRKYIDIKDMGSASSSKRLATAETVNPTTAFQTPNTPRRGSLSFDASAVSPALSYTPRDINGPSKVGNNSLDTLEDAYQNSQIGLPAVDCQPGNTERMTLDMLVVQYLKHQHRQCPVPITTLPPLSLLHPHVCPEPSRSLNAPANVTARVGTREFRKHYGGIQAHRRDRQFVYSRFKPLRTCRDDAAVLTCITFLNDPSRIAAGGLSGELKIFNMSSVNAVESYSGHQSHVTTVQSVFTGGSQLILSSCQYDVRLWDASTLSSGPLHSFDGCKAGRFNHSGTMLAAFSSDSSPPRDVLLYDVQTYSLELKLSDSSNYASGLVRGNTQSLIHFSPSDSMLLWNGVLWDRRSSGPVHRFDQFTDYGGGGFHPAGNEVILNSEVWDLRKFKLLRSVPSLDQTVITFNSSGDVIYAILRRNLDELTSAVHPRRVRHPLFPAFRTVDALNYSDIATVQVDRCVLDLATEPTDSFLGVVAMDDHEEMYSSARFYEVGRRRPTDDDSDPDDDGAETDEEDEENNESDGEDSLIDHDLDGVDSDSEDDVSNDGDNDEDDEAEEEEEEDFNIDDVDFEGATGLLGIVTEAEDDDSELLESFSSGEEGDFVGNGFGF